MIRFMLVLQLLYRPLLCVLMQSMLMAFVEQLNSPGKLSVPVGPQEHNTTWK